MAQIEAMEQQAIAGAGPIVAVGTAIADDEPATVVEMTPSVLALRRAAAELETAACQLEDHELYDRADQLRGLAAQLRRDARGGRGVRGPAHLPFSPEAPPIPARVHPEAHRELNVDQGPGAERLRREVQHLREQMQQIRRALAPAPRRD